ncbi:hypothetical protein [Escherichia coli]|nr:hypothetical protein [Escherichia coli]EIG2106150.1 hypothetical protein [Escherichia coli]EIG2114618.1 hypothetical protein [Escherichia coli]MCF6748863.1 hypothetical protein [Escherichia coli]MCV8236683.1 hypothetical protein [Escherichia coli]MCV8524211.1 hypothetical protein [Escherichia coli]
MKRNDKTLHYRGLN